MSELAPTIGADEQILADFVQALENSDDRDAVMRKFCGDHPALAKEFEAMAGMIQRVTQSRPELDEQVPEILGGFRLRDLIAKGGMGEVYEAYEERLQRRVAIKIIRKGRISPLNRARFLREQMFLARLHQTHTVPIFAAGEVGSLQYYAMPYIDGAALHHVVRTALVHETAHAGKTPTLAELAKQYRSAQAANEPTVPPHLAKEGSQSPDPSRQAADTLGAQKEKLTLSTDYFRSVAQVMADAADALHNAHQTKILHRDVKPSNLMVDTNGQCWIIDFGLAGFAANGAKPAPSADLDSRLGPLTVSGVMGTPHYMAPEQWHGKADPRSDVWGLGATLYELLTLRRAFDADSALELEQSVREREPTSPTTLVPKLPRDLAAICKKALQKEPAKRYQTAGEFAEDLRRWRRWEPTIARPARAPRRVALWARRNKGWAAAIVVALLSLIAVGGFAIALAAAAEEAKRVAEEGERKRHSELLINEIQRTLLTTHTSGWTEKAWGRVRELTNMRKGDASLRDQIVATMVGLDAERIGGDINSASSVVFSSDGKQLLIGGWLRNKPSPTRLWDAKTGGVTEFKRVSDGPVAFSKDGTPLQLVRVKGGLLHLVNLTSDEVIREFRQNIKGADGIESAVSADASRVASIVWSKDEKVNSLIVWDATEGKELFRKETPGRRIAFTPDGQWLASANEGGHLALWSVVKGKQEFTLSSRHLAVHCLAFGPNPWYAGSRAKDLQGWLLAAGDAGGMVTIWDLETRLPRTFCHGSSHQVSAVAFSPDGLTLASAGRQRPKLWDVVTGRLLLDMVEREFMQGIAFSPDGQQVAVGHIPVFHPHGGFDVLRLADSRGLRILRGLSSPVIQVRLSADGKRLAAIAQNWQVGLWDFDTGTLLRILDVPQGFLTDNAAFGFSPDGKRFAFASGQKAKLWEVESGNELSSWDLPPGMADRLVFHQPTGHLLLFRVETKDGKLMPTSIAAPDKHPRVCQIRRLTVGKTPELIATQKDFNLHVYDSVVAPDGSYFAAVGVARIGSELRRMVKVYDGPTGKELLQLPAKHPKCSIGIQIDPTGKLLGYTPVEGGPVTLVEMPSGKLLETGVEPIGYLSPGAKYVAVSRSSLGGIELYRKGEKKPLVHLGMDMPESTAVFPFHPDGTRLAWGNANGSVTLADLAEIQRRLAKVGLEW
jgi:serine/threonine protein kinase/WD40 repeat protein